MFAVLPAKENSGFAEAGLPARAKRLTVKVLKLAHVRALFGKRPVLQGGALLKANLLIGKGIFGVLIRAPQVLIKGGKVMCIVAKVNGLSIIEFSEIIRSLYRCKVKHIGGTKGSVPLLKS